MRRTAAILTLIAVVSLLGASAVRAGDGAGVSAGRTTGPALIGTIVIDVTGGQGTEGKGLTSIRAQKASTSAAVIFESSKINGWGGECIALDFSDIQASTDRRFIGLMDGWVDVPGVLSSLFEPFGYSPIADKAVITDTDYAECTTVNGKEILSFTAVIQFEKP
jgi:hypothetical protein